MADQSAPGISSPGLTQPTSAAAVDTVLSSWAKRFFDWLLLREAWRRADADETAAGPSRIELIKLARDYAAVADVALDFVEGVSLEPVLTLYREAIFLVISKDFAGKRALTAGFETDPQSFLSATSASSPALGQFRHVLAMHAALTCERQARTEQREAAVVTRASVHAGIELAAVSRTQFLRRRRGWRVAAALTIAAGLLAGIIVLAGALFSPTDLARGRPWSTSSSLGDLYSANLLFHTNEEVNPWFEIDLGSPKTVRSLYVKNRADSNKERAVPLVVELATSRSSWVIVARRDEAFDVWNPSFSPTQAQYVRLRVLKRTLFHLERVRVF